MADINGKNLVGVKLSEHKGFPMLVFGTDMYPFKFGATKAKHLLEAVARNGTQAVVDAMIHLVRLSDHEWVQKFTVQPQAVAHIAEESEELDPVQLANEPGNVPPADDEDESEAA